MSSSESATPGRKRDDALTERILFEAVRQLNDRGLSAFRIEQLAADVGCGKAAIYRRWSTPAELAAAALSHSLRISPDVDLGDAVAELMRLNDDNLVLTDEDHVRLVVEVTGHVWSALFDPEVRTEIWRQHFAKRREIGRAIIARGKERGQIAAHIDPDTVLDALSGFLIYRGHFRDVPISADGTRSLIRVLLGLNPTG